MKRFNNRKRDCEKRKQINCKWHSRSNFYCWTRFAKKSKRKWRIIVNFIINEKESSILFSIKNNEWDKHWKRFHSQRKITKHYFACVLILSSKQKSCRQKNLCLRYKRKLLKQNSNQDRSWSKSSTRNSKKRFVSLSKKQKILFRKKRLKKSFIKISISWILWSNFASF